MNQRTFAAVRLRRVFVPALLAAGALLLPFEAFAQNATTRVTGSMSAILSAGDSVQILFTCTGYPTCTGTYTAAIKDVGCPNTITLNDRFVATGLQLAQPGPIQGQFTLAGSDYHDGVNADGTCFIRPGTAVDSIFDYTGRWNGSTGTFTINATDAQNLPIVISGSFTADIPTANPVFPMAVTGTIDFARANIAAIIQFRPQDVNTTGSVYVFALAPVTRVLNAAALAKEDHLGILARGSPKDTPVQCVLAQLTASGQLQGVSAANLQAAITNVLSAQGQAVTVLNNVATPNIAGATFYVGYGPNATAMINNGINRSAVSVPGTQSCQPTAPQAGWWWNPAEAGRGFSLEVQGNNIFFASYLYDASGRANWYAALGPTSLDGSLFTGRLIAFSQGQTLTGTYKPPAPATDAGAVTITFNDASHGALIWQGGAVPIERFNIVANGLTAAPLANQPENGWWWNPSESGRGFFLEWQGGSAFVAGYMYDPTGNPLWYASFLTTTNPRAMQGGWMQFANGQTLTGAYKPAAVINANVGSLGLQFQTANSGTMTLPDGRQIAISRFRF